jgi:multiple sugar transport system permease protein
MTALSRTAARIGKTGRLKRGESIGGYACIAPWLAGFMFFTLGPMLASLYYSFTNFRVINVPRWVGMENYVYAFTKDYLFWTSLQRTLTWTLLTVPIGMMGSMLAAILLNQGLAGTAFFRTLFYLPSLTPVAAAAVLWKWILHSDAGALNYLLEQVGIQGPGWLVSPDWALFALALIALWTGIGGNRMIIFLAGLQGVPQELYEAAEIDGANGLQKTLNVTIPLISPTVFFNLILGVIGSFQVFAMAFITTKGGPAYATWFYALHIYTQAFESFDMGYASALSWVLFIIVVSLTLAQFQGSGRWVYYEGGPRT